MLKEKVIVVIGGAGLLGQAFVKAVVEKQGTVIVADVNLEKAKNFSEKSSHVFADSCIQFEPVDITAKDSIQTLIATVSSQYKKIDAVVNSAYPRNQHYGRDFLEVEFSDFCENVDWHLGGYFLTCQQFGQFFKQQGYGNIINVSSIYGVVAPRFDIYKDTKMTMPIEYAVIKSGILHMTRYLAKYFKASNIRVNAISPGGIADKQPENFQEQYKKYCMGKGMLDVDDIVGALLFLLSDGAKYINGQNIIVDDGFTL